MRARREAKRTRSLHQSCKEDVQGPVTHLNLRLPANAEKWPPARLIIRPCSKAPLLPDLVTLSRVICTRTTPMGVRVSFPTVRASLVLAVAHVASRSPADAVTHVAGVCLHS